MLQNLIACYGIGNHKNNNEMLFHIFIIGIDNIKLFMREDGSWTEDINERAETDDFIFAYEQLGSAFDTEEQRNMVEAGLLF